MNANNALGYLLRARWTLTRKYIVAITVAIALLSSTIVPFIDSVEAAVPLGFSDTLVAGGLFLPTAMEVAPDGRIFVSEKGGDLRIIENGVLLSEPFLSVAVDSVGERGLMDIAFDPNFMSNGYVYIYYTEQDEPIHNRVSRFAADPINPNKALPGSELPILELEEIFTEAHIGGGLEFGPDGKLYVSVGENYYSYLSQSLTSRLGKILRINPDGTIPTDNPFYNVQGAYQEIWALGLRNPFTMAFDPVDNRFYINDVGQHAWEEINSGLAGANYGWPNCEGTCNDAQFVDPQFAYAHPTDGSGASIAGAAFYRANQFPAEYQGSFFFGDYVQGFIKRLTPSNQLVDFADNLNSPVDIEISPDGSLYYASIAAGQVRKISYDSSGNNYPSAVASVTPTSGLPPLSVTFDGSESNDPDSDLLSYTWNFGDGSPEDQGISVEHTYSAAGQYAATLTVTDGNGGTDTDFVWITVGNPPVGSITAPTQGTTYSGGDTIFFSGAANDAEDGTLPPSAFEWTMVFHHNTHTHPFQQYSGITNGSFVIPTVGETDHDVWYRIYLEVTDSNGLTHVTSRDLLPNKSTVTLAANMTGLNLLLDGQPHSTPHVFQGVEGISRTLEAPLVQSVDGQSYQYDSWSDGGTRIHTISTPESDTTYTAIYSTDGGESGPTHTLTVKSSNLSGEPITGFYTVVFFNGAVVDSGFTPFDFAGSEGETYAVQVQDYNGTSFDHWENGDTNRNRTITIGNSNLEMTAFYRTTDDSAPSSYNLSVRSADLDGNTMTGYYTVISQNGTPVSTGFTPLTYLGQPNETYAIQVQDYGGATFDHWEDGSTERNRNITLTSNLIITAHFSLPPPVLTVESVDLSGNPLPGYYTTISQNGTVLATGFTPVEFNGTRGAEYTVGVQNYGEYVFDHWEDGSTERTTRTVTLDADTTVTAYYSNQSSLTVTSADLSGNEINEYLVSRSSLDFNASSAQYVTIPDDSSLDMGSNSFSISARIKPELLGEKQNILGKRDTSSLANPGYAMYLDSDNLVKFHLGDGSAERVEVAGTSALVGDQWYHILVTVDREGLASIYLDGVQDGTGNVSSQQGSISNSAVFSIARNSAGIDHYASMKIDDVMMFANELSPSNIDTIYNGGLITSGLISWWDFNDAAGSMLSDQIGSNDGTLVNSPVWTADVAPDSLNREPIIIWSNGTIVETGIMPLVYNGNTGAEYTVEAKDFGSYTFDHWEDGSTERTRILTLNENTNITAHYTSPTLTIRTVDLSDNPLLGYYTIIESEGSIQRTGFTPLAFAGQLGETYTVQVQDYNGTSFDHWEDGSTERTRVITPTESQTITAYYSTST